MAHRNGALARICSNSRRPALWFFAGQDLGDVMRERIFVLALLAGVAASGSSAALDASGETVAVVPDASAGGAGGHRVLKIKGPIFMGDVITTDVRGQVDIIFV